LTPFYASIEQLDEKEAHSSYDIWSLGITLYSLMARKEPYRQISNEERKKAM
jgi:serine/threonine protein kinase